MLLDPVVDRNISLAIETHAAAQKEEVENRRVCCACASDC